MNNPPKTTAEKVKILAKFMDWEIYANGVLSQDRMWMNPYENWDHTHVVLEEIKEDDELFEKWIMQVCRNSSECSAVHCLMKSSQAEILDALISCLPPIE